MTTTHPRESLYVIQDSLQILMDAYEAAELEGDSEALAVIDKELTEYVNTKEPAKVASYIATINQQRDIKAACKRERERIEDIERRADALEKKLLANALQTMQAFGVKELRAHPGGGLRLQNAGGMKALLIDEPKLIPDRFKKVVSTPDSGAIRKALEVGETVPGCRLEERKKILRVV